MMMYNNSSCCHSSSHHQVERHDVMPLSKSSSSSSCSRNNVTMMSRCLLLLSSSSSSFSCPSAGRSMMTRIRLCSDYYKYCYKKGYSSASRSRSSSSHHLLLLNPSHVHQQKRFLNLQEYQAKELLSSRAGVAVQEFRVVTNQRQVDDIMTPTPSSSSSSSSFFSCPQYVVKAQVLAGGRGRGHFVKSGLVGGVRVTPQASEAASLAKSMLGDRLITAQTCASGVLVTKVMIAEALDLKQELYVALLLDRSSSSSDEEGGTGLVLVASSRGGMDIETVAAEDPSAIHKFDLPIISGHPLDREYALRIVQQGLGLTTTTTTTGGDSSAVVCEAAADQLIKLHSFFLSTDATLIEINPLGVTPDERVVCFDAKLDFDENAEFRQPWISRYKREVAEAEAAAASSGGDNNNNNSLSLEDREVAAKYGLHFLPMPGGDIGCLVNGAGLAMATMDIIQLMGGRPANFLDCGGGVTAEGVAAAFGLITRDPAVKAILVNIFGGIVDCDTIAAGLVAARDSIRVPLIVRLEGTNREAAVQRLAAAGSIITASDLEDAAAAAVAAAAAS